MADVDGAYTLLRSRPDAQLMVTRGLGHSRILRDRTVSSRVVEHVTDTATACKDTMDLRFYAP